MDAETKARLKREVSVAAKQSAADQSSKYIGVWLVKEKRRKKWRARLRSGDKVLFQQYCETEEEAARAYDRALLLLCPHRKTKKLNFPQ